MFGKTYSLVAVSLALAVACSVAIDPEISASCNSNCTLPECLCSATRPPNGMDPRTIPQIIYLTFERGVTVSNYPLYQQIFANRVNPNGAQITGTFFVSHEYTDYTYVHQLYRQGHEIAVNTISYRSEQQYWKNLNESMWREEANLQRETLSYLAAIPIDEIQGFRAPFLTLNGDQTYRAISEDFRYDSSRPTRSQSPNLWPYTADYDSTQDCQITPCPNGTYPGFWVSPIVDFFGDDGSPCAQLNSCVINATAGGEANSTYEFIKRNFYNHYNGQRAPFGLYTAWDFLMVEERLEGYLRFIDEVLKLGDVFVVSIGRGLDWVQNPQTIENVDNIESWKPFTPPGDLCDFPFACTYTGSQQLPPGFFGERLMKTCVPCPRFYPWVLNNLGSNPYA